MPVSTVPEWVSQEPNPPVRNNVQVRWPEETSTGAGPEDIVFFVTADGDLRVLALHGELDVESVGVLALVPVEDFRRARAALREIQERWEAAGRVPRRSGS